MVVNQDDGRRRADDGGAEDFPWMDEGRVQDPSGHRHVTEDAMLCVEEKRVELLVGEVPQPRTHEAVDIPGTPDPGPLGFLFFGGSKTQLQGGYDASRGRPTHPGNRLELPGRGLG